MTTSSRKIPFRTSLGAGFALAACLFAVPAVAADANDASGNACRQEMRRVAVWPQGGNPKIAQMPRFENREVTVCNGKVVSQQPQRNASSSHEGMR